MLHCIFLIALGSAESDDQTPQQEIPLILWVVGGVMVFSVVCWIYKKRKEISLSSKPRNIHDEDPYIISLAKMGKQKKYQHLSSDFKEINSGQKQEKSEIVITFAYLCFFK